ncbi:MAG: hypothetical protein ACK46O_14105, partial [Flavobacteriia bacterium]
MKIMITSLQQKLCIFRPTFKISTLILSFVMLTNIVWGQVQFYFQDFEIANDWTFTQPAVVNGANFWVHGVANNSATTGAAAFSGRRSLQIWGRASGAWNSSYGSGNTTGYTRSARRTFNFSTIPSGSAMSLKYHVLCVGESNNDDLRVMVSTNSGVSWTLLDGPVSGVNAWSQRTINLSSYVGNSSVIVSFEWRNNNSVQSQPGVRLDNILVEYAPPCQAPTVNAGSAVNVCPGQNASLAATASVP